MLRFEAFIHRDWRVNGMSQVIVARFRENGRADLGFFLVDLWCLGVKDAFLVEATGQAGFEELLRERIPEEYRQRLHPTCAKKLIAGALAYAESFGFAPHRDYRKARRVLSGLDAADCPETYSFGHDGKPCFAEGPDDAPERVKRVLAILQARCGADGYTYILAGTVPDESDAGDADDAREALQLFFDDEPETGPTFFELSGMITALQLCPTVVTPGNLLEKFWGPAGIVRDNADEVSDFLYDLGIYWNTLVGLVHECAAAAKGDEEAYPLDIYPEDFEDAAEMAPAVVEWARGFDRATREWPNTWGNALTREDLASHWTLVRAWADPEGPESRKVIQAREGKPSDPRMAKNLPLAILALIHALYPRSPQNSAAK